PGAYGTFRRRGGKQEQVAARPLPVGEGEPGATRVGRHGLDPVATGEHQRDVDAGFGSLDERFDPGRLEQRVIASSYEQWRAETFKRQADAFARTARGRQQLGAKAARFGFDRGMVRRNGDYLDA